MCEYDKALYELSKEYRSKRNKALRIEKEKAESMAYYNEHKEEITIGREAALLISSLARMSRYAEELTVEDILGKVDSFAELHFYYSKICERR